jgi:hypothetical protein
MARFHIGAVLDRVPTPRYFETLSHVELTLSGIPKGATIQKLRAVIPEGATLAIQVPPTVVRGEKGALRHQDPNIFTSLITALKSFRADRVVLVTGVELSPGPRDREALTQFAERLRKGDAPPLVWQSGGPWDAEDALAFAASIGIQGAIDPLEPPPGQRAEVYARVRAIGVRSRLGDGLLAKIAENLLTLGAEDTYVAIEAGDATKRGRRLIELLQGAVADTATPDDGEEESDDDGDDDSDDLDDE